MKIKSLLCEVIVAQDDHGRTLGTVAVDNSGTLSVVMLLQVTDARNRRQGVATAMMQRVIDHYGDRPIYVEPKPYLDKPMSEQHLREWYGKLGFRQQASGLMCRPGNSE